MKYEIAGVHDNGEGVKRAYLILDCSKKCSIPLRQGEAKQWAHGHVWGWDAALQPTIRPSVNCSSCGFHKTLIAGVWQ